MKCVVLMIEKKVYEHVESYQCTGRILSLAEVHLAQYISPTAMSLFAANQMFKKNGRPLIGKY